MTPEPKLRSACGGASCRPSKKRSKKSCIGSSWSPCCGERRFFAEDLRSNTCVVAMFTTAGSTRVTIPENELADGMGSGTARGVALVPANDNVFIAETLPETTEPIRMPTPSVRTTKKDAKIFRRRAQTNNSLTCSPIMTCSSCPQKTSRPPVKYNTMLCTELLAAKDALNSTLAERPGAKLAGCVQPGIVLLTPLL